MVDKVEALCPLGASYHISLNITLVFYTESSNSRPSFNYFKGYFVSLRSTIKDVYQTNRVQAYDIINDKWECFRKTIANVAYLSVPVNRKSAVKNKKQWMKKELKNLVEKKLKHGVLIWVPNYFLIGIFIRRFVTV